MSLKSETLKQAFAPAEPQLPRDLGEDLVLRRATAADSDPLALFHGRVFGRERFDELLAAYVRYYMLESHPVIGPSNVLVVEDTCTHELVSSMMLIPQTWTYAGIPFGVGRPEVVATDPAYRRRGLVRAQFEVIHAQSENMGHLVQGSTGIPWYYRQFGYEYALDLGGGRLAYFSNVPELKPADQAKSTVQAETEAYRVRAMTHNDLPFAASLYDRECARSLVACPRPQSLWQYLLDESPEAMAFRVPIQVIETIDGRAVGYLQTSRELWADMVIVGEIAFAQGQSVRSAMPAVLRWMKTFGETESQRQNKPVNAIQFALGHEHPVYEAIPELLPRTRIPYGWYIRVPDVPRFVRHIAPALNARLARSAMAGYTGELKISEYERGTRLIFENGMLVSATTWQPTVEETGECGFPHRTFLRLLFGEKSLVELRAFYPDCWAKDEADVLLNALFPKQNSCVMPVG
ncbi:MAG TPA: GNAT family N-acetyltransferase [Anaerolineae bacterium]